MSTVEIYSYEGDERLTKLQIVAKYAKVDVKLPPCDSEKEGQSESFKLNCHPMGKFPVAKTAEGYLFESNAIARYIARLDKGNTLYGASQYDTAQVDQWLDFVSNEVEPAAKVLIGLHSGFLPKNKEQEEAAWNSLLDVLKALDQQLEVRTFLVGERITLADISLASLLEEFLRVCMNPEKLRELVCLLRYVDTIVNQPNFAEIIKQRKPKPSEKPKVEKKEKVVEEKPVESEADAFAKEESQEKSMKKKLDSLPPSPTFIMDEFKRCYSNNDIRTIAAPFFFDKYDPEGYTCMWSKYKYNDELGPMVFMTSNLVGGMFQRMEALHKYVFGAVLIIGEEKVHEIVGFWIVRGRGMPDLMRVVDDIEHHSFTEISNIHDEKAKITDFLACDGDSFADKPVMDCKIFK
ncbi:elongation factor-1 gamma [Perkinsela sp. CCAP 1560/4]|nr:elongation factor-1 gamma [Perkinsela sp. CCAP 1560/4]|eukprot:KNH08061.1 elongation factor-1 gamma [Perkinsela sp. CCAP 1560/4]